MLRPRTRRHRTNAAASVLVALLWIIGPACAADGDKPIHGPILTWHDDPTSTMTVTWVERLPVDRVAAQARWRVGEAGFGYGDGDDKTVLKDMRDTYNRVYIRTPFKLAEADVKAPAELRIRYDDAFIAYLNGREIARRGVGEGRGAQAKIILSHEANDSFETIAIEDWAKLAKPGDNVLAIEAHNVTVGSSDLTLDPYVVVRRGAEDVQVIQRGGQWAYFAGADPPANWATPAFQRPDADVQAERREPEEPQFMPSAAWVRKSGGDQWQRVEGRHKPFADTGGRVHIVELKNLEAHTRYEAAISPDEPGLGTETWQFRTAPDTLTEPIRFVTGGDMGVTSIAQAVNRQAGAADPLFAMLGGDIAYANGRDASRWYAWLDNWEQFAVTPDGLYVPIVMCIGNHEMGSRLTPEQAEELQTHPRSKFFFSLFTLPDGKSNYVLDFGKYLSLFILDSNHAQRVEEQTDWLARALRDREDQRFKYACYHRPAYGTAKAPSLDVREHWCPLFEQARIDAAFENDHHTFKRSHPIKAGQINREEGILYLGDGAWGVGTRRIDQPTDLLAKALSINHLWKVTLDKDGARYEAIDPQGTVFDRWPR